MTAGDEDDLGGGVDLALLDKVVNKNAGVLPTGDSGDPSAILKPLSGSLSSCIERFGKIADCAFVFASDPEKDFDLLSDAKRHSHLIRPKRRTYSPSGRLHMVATGGHRGASTPGAKDEDDLFKLLKVITAARRENAAVISMTDSWAAPFLRMGNTKPRNSLISPENSSGPP